MSSSFRLRCWLFRSRAAVGWVRRLLVRSLGRSSRGSGPSWGRFTLASFVVGFFFAALFVACSVPHAVSYQRGRVHTTTNTHGVTTTSKPRLRNHSCNQPSPRKTISCCTTLQIIFATDFDRTASFRRDKHRMHMMINTQGVTTISKRRLRQPKLHPS